VSSWEVLVPVQVVLAKLVAVVAAADGGIF
jgi:hypothetical protein